MSLPWGDGTGEVVNLSRVFLKGKNRMAGLVAMALGGPFPSSVTCTEGYFSV